MPFTAAPPSVPVPVDSVDLGKVFEKRVRAPKTPQVLSTWHFAAKDKHSIDEVFRGPDGSTYVTADSFDTADKKHAKSYTAAYDPHGSLRWEYRPDVPGHAIKSQFFMADGSACVLSQEEGAWPEPLVVMLDSSGGVRWRYEVEGRDKADSVRPAPDGGVYLKAGDTVIKLDADGKKVWSKDLSIYSDEFFHVVTPDGGQLFASDGFCLNFGTRSFYRLDKNGKGHEVSLRTITSFPLEVADRLVYGGEDGKVHGLDLKTLRGWECQTESLRGVKTPFLGRDQNVYVEGRYDDDRLTCIAPDGSIKWQRNVTDHHAGGFNEIFQVDKDGTVYYVLDGGEALARILPDGRPGTPLPFPEGISSFRPGGDGNVYVWTGEGQLAVRNVEKGTGFAQPVDVEYPHTYDVKDVLPGGRVVLQRMDDIYVIPMDVDRELQEELAELQKTQKPAQPPPKIEKGDDWVIIGDIRVPRRQ